MKLSSVDGYELIQGAIVMAGCHGVGAPGARRHEHDGVVTVPPGGSQSAIAHDAT